MKRNVENMEDEINRLSATMKSISTDTESINTSLHGNREQIEKLSGVSILLNKRQFLFDLPSRLNKCISTDSYTQAIRYYNGTRYGATADQQRLYSILNDVWLIDGGCVCVLETFLPSTRTCHRFWQSTMKPKKSCLVCAESCMPRLRPIFKQVKHPILMRYSTIDCWMDCLVDGCCVVLCCVNLAILLGCTKATGTSH
jgi:hypothetical protein